MSTADVTSESERPLPHAEVRTTVRRYAWLALPAAALFELVAHFVQTRPRRDEADYHTASALLQGQVSPRDLVVFSPLWTDPLGRRAATSWLDATRAFYTETARFERVFEVARDNGSRTEFESMPVVRTFPAGDLLIRERKNLNYVPVIDDLLTHMPKQAQVFAKRSEQDVPCPYAVTQAQAGPWDPAKPKGSYTCGASWTAPMVLVDGAYRARYCMFVSSPATMVQFEDVHFGKELVTQLGFHRLREQKGGGLSTIVYRIRAELPDGRIEMRTLGQVQHRSGEPWSEFRLETPLLAGQTGDLFAEIQGNGHVCFESTTR